MSAGAVAVQLARVGEEARHSGFATAIGHPHDGTIEALGRWLPTLKEQGLALVPISQIVQRNLDLRSRTASN
jgi:polysaccharide deacetylase 2 family uncharacterized protein YibQ